MKILFVSPHDDVHSRWINPLREKGWGAVLARSQDEAGRMMVIHGEGVEAIVVHEKFVSFAEMTALPFVVLTEKWTSAEIQKHRNSSRPAKGYLSAGAEVDALVAVWAPTDEKSSIIPTETGATTRSEIRLVQATGLLRRPEKTRTQASVSLILKAPSVQLGGKPTNTAIKAVPEPLPESIPEVPAPVLELVPDLQVIEQPSEVSNDATQMIDRRDLAAELSTLEPESIPEVLSFDSFLEPEVTPPPVSSAPLFNEPRPAMKLVSEVNPDVEALRNYLAMREQDVAVLTGQLRSSKDRISHLESQFKNEKSRNTDLEEKLARSEQLLKNYDQEKRIEMEVVEKQVDDLVDQLRERTEKARTFETRLRLMSEEVNKVKERVRVDIRRIRVREKELEGQLEILKKDSSALLQARDEKILELKRRLDLLEFNMELAQEQFEKERRTSEDLRARLKDAAQAMKQANGLLEQ